MDILRSLLVWVCGILLIVVMFPAMLVIWLLLLPFDKERLVTHKILILQSKIFRRAIPVKSFAMEGSKKAVKGTTYVVVSNHQSMLDIIYLNSLGYNYKWISKIENLKIPVLGWYLGMAGYITIDRGNEESKLTMLQRANECLMSGISIMIFPEGTRSANSEIGFFKRGAFQLAIEAGVPLLPVVIDGTGGILPKHGFILGTGHDVRLRVLDPVHPQDFGTEKPEELALHIQEIMKKSLNEIRNQS